VRARTTALAVLVSALALVAAGVLLLLAFESSLVAARDEVARARAEDLVALVFADAVPTVLSVPREDNLAQVVDGSGNVVAASANIAGQPRVTELEPSPTAAAVRTVRGVLDEGEAEDYRIWAVRAGSATVYVGSSLESVEEATLSLRRTLAAGIPVLLTLLGVGTWVVVGRALRPVEAIRSEVAAMPGDALDRRVTVPTVRDEVGRLAVTMNELLDRLQAAGERERRFLADAAHELQSPLAAFRAHLEVSRAHPDDTDWQASVDDLLAESRRLEQLVRDLLFLARVDSGRTAPVRDLLDLDDIVLAEAQRTRGGSRVTVDTSGVSAAPVRGEAEELTRLVRNLLDNAERHAAGTVTIGLAADGSHARLTVADDGPGIPATDRQAVFDRFTRLDSARSRAQGGTGLGLSIARHIAERHGGTIQVADADGPGACFVVLLPVADSSIPPRLQPVPGRLTPKRAAACRAPARRAARSRARRRRGSQV
jgi:signal transduction histidine kinase